MSDFEKPIDYVKSTIENQTQVVVKDIFDDTINEKKIYLEKVNSPALVNENIPVKIRYKVIING